MWSVTSCCHLCLGMTHNMAPRIESPPTKRSFILNSPMQSTILFKPPRQSTSQGLLYIHIWNPHHTAILILKWSLLWISNTNCCCVGILRQHNEFCLYGVLALSALDRNADLIMQTVIQWILQYCRHLYKKVMTQWHPFTGRSCITTDITNISWNV